MLQQVGRPQAVYDEPANVFVARFIGSPAMNTLEADVVRQGETLVAALPGARVPLPPATAAAVASAGTDRLVVGVRPEHLTVGSGPVPATVAVVEALGHERHVVCRLADGTLLIVRQPSSDPAPGPGTVLHLSFAPDDVHLFDAGTGTRIGARP